MSYFTKEMAIEALAEMQKFYNSLNTVFTQHGYTFNNSLGRRNALLSLSQEKEVAIALRKKFSNVVSDGRPGQPDVVIKDIDKELECKLTSGRGKSGSIDFQTDWGTLKKKGSLDYLYFVANKEFDEFCVLFFEGLTCDDFHPPANGSRGKSRMNKKIAMSKVSVLVGSVKSLNSIYINNYRHKIKAYTDNRDDAVTECLTKMLNINATTKVAHENVNKIETRYDKKIEKINQKINRWMSADKKFKIILETI